jgi:hypothetical protein|tara:strand:+ start:200 stop:439 length:240 start_codon:yes stop_codon:yes gene_type:complete
MALNKNTKRTIIILSSLAAVIIIGIATGVINFDPVTKSKSNTYGKSDQCFAKLKKKLSKEKMLAIMNKKKWNQSFCDFL